MIRVASIQSDVVFGDPNANAASAVAHLDDLAERKVQLAVFPEAFLTGYCVESHAEASRIAIPSDHPSLARLQEACDRTGIVAVVGFAEADGRLLYNSAAILEPGTPARFHRKAHLPELGLDKYVLPGRYLTVWDTRIGRLGVLICFDLRMPEATRVLALAGAEIIALPTNWPEGAEVSADHICIARAAENRVFFITCNRVGEENGFRFIGRSKIIGVGGQVLASAGAEATVLTADLDPAEARDKRTVTIPGKYETAIFGARRPELYGPLAER